MVGRPPVRVGHPAKRCEPNGSFHKWGVVLTNANLKFENLLGYEPTLTLPYQGGNAVKSP